MYSSLTDLIRISPSAARMIAPAGISSIQGVRSSDERSYGGAKVDAYSAASRHGRYLDDDVEVLGLGGRGRPVVSLPSSAFFAQHLSQNPEPTAQPRTHGKAADGAYRNAADLGVTLMNPDPISMVI